MNYRYKCYMHMRPDECPFVYVFVEYLFQHYTYLNKRQILSINKITEITHSK